MGTRLRFKGPGIPDVVNVSQVTGRSAARARLTQLIGIMCQEVVPGWPDMPDRHVWGPRGKTPPHEQLFDTPWKHHGMVSNVLILRVPAGSGSYARTGL